MNKTKESQIKASKLYRERQKAKGVVTVRTSTHYSLVTKFKALVAKFKEENKEE